jgi:hypothetical protein
MNMPGFDAESSLGQNMGIYWGKAVYGGKGAGGVLPQFEKTCGACRANSDCRKVDNYCGGCHCLALGPGETGPRCHNPVRCFAAPCSVTPGEPVCENGRCVLR